MPIESTLVRIRRHLANPGSYHRRIITGFAWTSFFVLVAKIAGAAKEMAIAWRYGVSDTVDAYVLIFHLASWPVGLCFSVLALVLVPLIARTRLNESESLPRFGGELFGAMLLGAAVLGTVCYFAFYFVLDSGIFGLSLSARNEAISMVGPLSWLLPIGIVISFLSAWIMSYGSHGNTVLEGLPAIVLLLVLLLSMGSSAQPLVWGTVVGVLLQLLFSALLLRSMGKLYIPRLRFESPAWKQFLAGIAVIGVGQALLSLTSIVDQLFAARLGSGAIATFSYASRLISLILALGATAIGRSTLPIFSDIVTDGRSHDLRSLAVQWATWMFGGGVVIALVGWFLSPLFVRLLFERGAFTAEDTSNVAEVLRYALTQVPFYFASIVLVSLLAANGRYREIALMAGANLGVKVISMFALVPLLGLNAIALSATAMYAATLVFFAHNLGHRRSSPSN